MSEKKPFDVFQEWADSYLNFEKLPQKDIFWLDTMRYLCDRFKKPEDSYNSVHVAGSKGKGSVTVMTASILKEAGLNCGMYTSPHILNLAERIGRCDGPFPDNIYEKAVLEIIPKVSSIIPDDLPGGREPTWFELVTLYAFICFRYAEIDWGVFETGLGGRLDATNIISPKICLITPIELEHTEYLGDTIEKIAGEKAGIIKENTPVCISVQKPVCREVFSQQAYKKNAPIVFIEDVIDNVHTEINLFGMHTYIDFGKKGNLYGFKRPIKAALSMPGAFQAANAALSAIGVKILFPDIDESVIERGLEKASLPGRFEILYGKKALEKFISKDKLDSYLVNKPLIPYQMFSDNIPFIILDGAHTENSVEFTLNTLNDVLSGFSLNTISPHLLFACAADKHCTKFAQLIAKNKIEFSNCILTIPGNNKQSNLQKLTESFSEVKIEYTSDKNFESMIHLAFENAAKSNSPLLVTGSFYLVAEVKKFLLRLQTGLEKIF